MKKLPEVNESFEELCKMLLGPIKSKLLLTGIELEVFNQLSEPKSAEAVAEAISSHPANTRLFLDGLAASDLVLKKNGLLPRIRYGINSGRNPEGLGNGFRVKHGMTKCMVITIALH